MDYIDHYRLDNNIKYIAREETLKLLDDYVVQKQLLHSLFGSHMPLTKEQIITLIREEIKKNNQEKNQHLPLYPTRNPQITPPQFSHGNLSNNILSAKL